MSLNAAVAVYATRYALGRKTGAPADVREFIEQHRDEIMRNQGCRDAILRDIRERRELGVEKPRPPGCDREQWERVESLLGEQP